MTPKNFKEINKQSSYFKLPDGHIETETRIKQVKEDKQSDNLLNRIIEEQK